MLSSLRRAGPDATDVASACDQAGAEAAVFRAWALDIALPLWTGAGYDSARRQFEEALTFSGEPVPQLQRRLMVQARQISVCCLASIRGWRDCEEIALAAGRSMIERFWATDGPPGWVFSVNPQREIADSTRDLYAHAFVLFALAWMIRLAPGEQAFGTAVDDTLHFLDESFADPIAGGYWDSLPADGALRRQNPHMHLVEAMLELFEATGEERFLERAQALVDLALERFIDSETGVLCEYFDAEWRVAERPGLGPVEPGHQFEWAWLLRRYESLGGASRALARAIERLLGWGLSGTDPLSGRIVDQLTQSGEISSASSRCWPHCEAIKILAVERSLGTATHDALIERLLGRLIRSYCRPELRGGWIDQLDREDQPVSQMMPGSTLYHLMFALAEWEQCFLKRNPKNPCSRTEPNNAK